MDTFALFAESVETARRLARTCNPQTSKDAADKMVKSGELNRQEKNVYSAILMWTKHCDTFTTKDIATCISWCTYDKAYDICRKRFSGIYDKGKIDRLNTKGGIYREGDELMKRDGCAVWRLK